MSERARGRGWRKPYRHKDSVGRIATTKREREGAEEQPQTQERKRGEGATATKREIGDSPSLLQWFPFLASPWWRYALCCVVVSSLFFFCGGSVPSFLWCCYPRLALSLVVRWCFSSLCSSLYFLLSSLFSLLSSLFSLLSSLFSLLSSLFSLLSLLFLFSSFWLSAPLTKIPPPLLPSVFFATVP